MKHQLSTFVLGIIFFSCCPAFGGDAVQPPDPIYIRIDNGWKGFFARNEEFLEYSIIGSQVKLQIPYHVLFNPDLGLMITFAEIENPGPGKSILEEQRNSELEYWRKRAKKVEIIDRRDLRGTREDLMVTKFDIYGQNANQFMDIYMISVASKDGAYVLAISPASNANEDLIKTFIDSIKLIKKRFDPKEESAKIRMGN